MGPYNGTSLQQIKEVQTLVELHIEVKADADQGM